MTAVSRASRAPPLARGSPACEVESVRTGHVTVGPCCGQSVSAQTGARKWTQGHVDSEATGVQSPCAVPTQALCVWYGVCFYEATRDVVILKYECTTTQVGVQVMPEQPQAETLPCPIEPLPLTDIYTALGTQPQGLTHAEAAARLQYYGRNTIRTVATTPLVHKFLAHFTHLMALLLWVGGLLGFLAQMPQLGIAIWLVNLINGALD